MSVKVIVDVTDTSGYVNTSTDRVVFRAKNTIGAADTAGRVISTAPVVVELRGGAQSVNLEPGPHIVTIRARGQEDNEFTFTVPDDVEELTLRDLLENHFDYDPEKIAEAQRYAVQAKGSADAAAASEERLGSAETIVENTSAAAASAATAATEADRAKTEADRSTTKADNSATEADRSKTEANRATSAATNAATDTKDLLQGLVTQATGERVAAQSAAASADTHKTEAKASEDAAAASASLSTAQAERSETAADTSRGYNDTAWTARQDAISARDVATQAKTDAVSAKVAAQESATAAQGSAERALAAEAASESAQSAAESARDDAASSASASAQSASALSTSADASASSASASSTSASNAATSANNAAESEALALEHSKVTVGKITTGVEVIDLKDKFVSGVSMNNVTNGDMPSVAAVVRCGSTCTLVLNRVKRDEKTWGTVLPAGSIPVEWLPVDADGNRMYFSGHLFCGNNGDAAEVVVKQNGSVYVSSMVPGQSYWGSVSWPAPSMELPIADAVLDIKADVEASASAAAQSEQSAFEYAQSAAQAAQLEVERLVNGAPEALDTLGELAVALEDQQDAVAVLVSTISEKPSKEYVDAVKTTADAALPASKIQVVAALPESPVEGTIYLVTGA